MITTRLTLPIALFTAGSMLSACGSETTTPPADSGVMDVPTVDVRPDVAPVDRPAADRAAPPPPECPSTEDLSMMAPRSDGAIHVSGSNAMSELDRFGTLRSGCISGGVVGATVIYTYTMRADGALRVSTANPGTTSATFDTYVAVLGACISAGRSLACNDNTTDTTVGASHARHSIATTGFLARGQRVYVLVGGRGSTTASVSSGDFELTLREFPAGADGGPCRLSGEACGAGLLCTVLAPMEEAQGLCRRPVAMGMPCVAGDLCARGSTCLANPGDTTRGTCRGDATEGGVCLVGRAACGAGLTCTVAIPEPASTGLCRPTLMAGAECDPALVSGVCSGATSCRSAPSAMNPGRFLCYAQGARGGLCRTGSPRCDMGLECSSATTPTCRAQVMLGAACDPTGNADFCEMGASCAPDAMFAGGTCATNGTAPGTPCRPMEPFCDAGLTCDPTGVRSLCRRTATGAAACDWRYNSVGCEPGSTCVPAGPSRGVCAAPVMETEPNSTPTTAQGPITQSGIFRGGITPGSDIDCYRVTAPMGASLYIETNSGTAGACPTGADTIVAVYNPAGTRIAENDDIASNQLCSRLNGLTSGPLHNVVAGNYAVCVRSYNTGAAIASYHVTIAIVPLTN